MEGCCHIALELLNYTTYWHRKATLGSTPPECSSASLAILHRRQRQKQLFTSITNVKQKVLSTLKSCPTRKELLNSKRAAQLQKSCSTPKERLNSERAVNSKKLPNSERAAQFQKSCSIPKELLNSKRAAQLQKIRSTQKELSTLKSHTTHTNLISKEPFWILLGTIRNSLNFKEEKSQKFNNNNNKKPSESRKNLKSPKSDKNRRKSQIQEKDTTQHQVEQPAINGGFRKC